MSTRAVIVEDEPLAVDRLRRCLAHHEDRLSVVGEAVSGPQAVTLIDRTAPDLVFLDVQMPGVNGFEVLRTVRHAPAVIFTTAHHEYALPAFEWGAFDYLLKPFDCGRVTTALERYWQRSGSDTPDEPVLAERLSSAERQGPLERFFVKQGGHVLPVDVQDIDAIVAEGDYCRLHCGKHQHLVHLPLREFERRLEATAFLRIHRSAIVQIASITSVEPHGRGALVHVRADLALPASRSGVTQLRKLRM